MNLTVAHVYPYLLNLYGDSGMCSVFKSAVNGTA